MSASPPEKQQPPGRDWSSALRQVAWFVFLILLFSWWTTTPRQPPVQDVPYSEFKELVRLGKVAEVTLEGDRLTGTYVGVTTEGEERPRQRFTSTIPALEDPDLLPLLDERGVVVRARSRETSWWARSCILRVL